MAQTPTITANAGTARLYDGIEAVVPGVLHTIVQMALWDAVEDFCSRSNWWQTTVEFVLPIGAREVDLNPVSGDCIAILILELQGLSVWSVEPPVMIVDSGDTSQIRRGWARVSLKPARLSDRMPAALTDIWFETLKDGALARLYGQPAKPYSSPPLGAFHGARFVNGCNRARALAAQGNARRPSAWVFPYFARGRRR